MHISIFRSALLMILAITHCSCNADLNEWATKNATHLAWGAGTVCIAGATWILANRSSKERFAYLENEALRKKEADEKAAEENKRKKIEDKSLADRIAIEQAHNFLEQLGNLFERYTPTPADQLSKNNEFQQLLLNCVLGNNAQPKRLHAFNETIEQLKARLFAIDNPQLFAQKAEFLAKLNWYQQQANTSASIISADIELTREHYELEQGRHMMHIAAERAMQEKLQTNSVRVICNKNEEIATTNVKTSKELHRTALSMTEDFRRQDKHVQDQISAIKNNVSEGIYALNAWQAAGAEERRIIAQLIPELIQALKTVKTIDGKLSTTLHNQTRILNILKEIRELPEDVVFMIEQATKNAQQDQASAPAYNDLDKQYYDGNTHYNECA